MNKLNISTKDKEILIRILSKYPYQFTPTDQEQKVMLENFRILNFVIKADIPEYEVWKN